MSGVIGASVRRSVAVSMLLLSFLAAGLVVSVGVAAADPPGPPTITDTDPDSPSRNDDPFVRGTTEAGTDMVFVYTTDNCSGQADSNDTETFTIGTGIQVSDLAHNTTTQLSAKALGPGGMSICSAPSIPPFPYFVDTDPPAVPVLTDLDPDSPANGNSVIVRGTAEVPSTVKLYTEALCAGTVAQSKSAELFNMEGFTVPVVDNTTTTFSARTTDALGNESVCSAPRTYVEDSLPPPAPTLTVTLPLSPANDNGPEIKGTAPGDAVTIKIYTNSGCTGAAPVSGTAEAFTSSGLTAPVGDNSSTTFYAKALDLALNESVCSASGVTFVEDSLAPGLPSMLSTSPASPANNNAPMVRGTAEAGSSVRLFTTSACTGTTAATGSAADFAAGLAVTVPDDSATTFFASAKDTAGNESGCSPISYVEDSTPPAAATVIASVPGSPADDNAPRIRGSAEPGSTVRLFATAGCSGSPSAMGSAADFASPGLAVSVADNTITSFQATATDAAGNVSLCSSSTLAYVESSPPQVKTAMTLTNAGGSTYIALPTKSRKITAKFSVAEVSPSSYRGPIKLKLHIEGLKLDKVPPGVELSSDKKTAVWTIAAAQSATPLTLRGRTRVKRRAKFGVEAQGAEVVATPPPVTVERAKGTVTLKAAGTGRRTLRTLTGTVAASTCDREGTGKLSLRTELSLGGAGYERVGGKPPVVHLDKPSGESKVCTFSVSTGLGRTPPRSVRFRFQVVSSYGGKSAKVRFRAR